MHAGRIVDPGANEPPQIASLLVYHSQPFAVSNTYAQGKYSDCMRSHGVPSIPDQNSPRSGAASQSSSADELAAAYKSAKKQAHRRSFMP